MVAFSIFWWDIYRYGIFYFISFLLCYWFLFVLGRKKIFYRSPELQKILTESLDSLMIAILLWVIVWGRLGHFFIYHLEDFLHAPLSVFEIWKGGMSFIWWIIGVSCALFCFKKIYKISFQTFLLLVSCLLVFVPLGIFLGRLWNYLNQELYGIVFQNSWWSEEIVNLLKSLNLLHVYPHVDAQRRINTNLLSMIFEWLLLFFVQMVTFLSMIKKKIFHPVSLISQFVMGYSLFRFLFEYLRNDSQSEFVGIFTKSQWFFFFFFFFGLLLLRILKRKNRFLLL